jgi:protein SCO1/2
MKTNLIVLSALISLSGATLTAESNPPACCAPVAPAKPACCVEEKPAAPLSTRSLYQLDAKWTNDAGREFTLTSLRGRSAVVAMFFAQCEYACPVLVNDMQRLRAAVPPDAREKIQFVLVTFDTARDTPEALRAFRERMSLDDQWTLLRADSSTVQELAMLLGVKFKQDARGQFAHSNLLTLLNREGEIVQQVAGLNADISEAAKRLATN